MPQGVDLVKDGLDASARVSWDLAQKGMDPVRRGRQDNWASPLVGAKNTVRSRSVILK
jgi:hypothetical protein